MVVKIHWIRNLLTSLAVLLVGCATLQEKEVRSLRDEVDHMQQDNGSMVRKRQDLADNPQLISLPKATVNSAIAASSGSNPGRTPMRTLKVIKLSPEDAESGDSELSASWSVGTAQSDNTIDDLDSQGERPMLRAHGNTIIDGESSSEPTPTSPTRTKEGNREFEKAILLAKQKKCSAAIERLGQNLVRYPDHPFAASAFFWRAECFFHLGDFNKAVMQYEALMARFPASSKIPDALYHMGHAHRKLGTESSAKQSFERLRREYPLSDAAKKLAKEGA